VVVAPIKSALRLTALNDAAARLGLKTGMALADARAMYPRLDVKDADPLADRHLLETVAEWCDRYTPLVGMQPPDGLVLDISGCAHLFGGEAALCDGLVRRLSAQGLLVRAAIADTVGCAWALARYGDDLSLPRTAGQSHSTISRSSSRPSAVRRESRDPRTPVMPSDAGVPGSRIGSLREPSGMTIEGVEQT